MRNRPVLSAFLVVAMVAVGCSEPSRPSVAEWEPVWTDLVTGIPTLAELGQPPDRLLCENAIGLVRSSEDNILPTPDRAIDEAVREWVDVAEDAFFECPPSSAAIPDLEFAYGQLERLEAEIAAVLAIDDPGR